MPFSFNPGQQGGQQNQVSASEAPPLIVPEAPSVSIGGTQVEVVSPFAFRNRNKSMFPVYFQGVIFLISGGLILITIILFSYQITLRAQIASMKKELEVKEASFPNLELDKMQKLSDRIKIINKVVNGRASPVTAFKILEASVLDDGVTYTKFALEKNRSGKGYDLSFSGQATSYRSLYQQIEDLNSKIFSKYFTKLEITGTGPLDKKGIGTFRVESVIAIDGIDPNTFSIEPIVDGAGATSTKGTVENTQAPAISTSTEVITP